MKNNLSLIRTIIKSAFAFIAIILCVNIKVSAQGYQSFFGENTTKYNIYIPYTCGIFSDDNSNTNYLSCGNTHNFVVSKTDTIVINDTVYYNVRDRDYSAIELLIREDTVKGQLFRYIEEFGKEYLMCDMSLEPGDTFRLPNWSKEIEEGQLQLDSRDWWYREEGAEITVDSVSYINDRKVIYFSDIKESNFYDGYLRVFSSTTFVEGIGPIYGPFGYIHTREKYLSVLLCVKKDDMLTHVTSSLLGCYQSFYSVEKEQVNPITIYPNPASNDLHIKIDDENFADNKLRIIDQIGHVVYSSSIKSDNEKIPVSHLSSGVYILQYISADKIFQLNFTINK
jgi:hypothetical protein